MEFCLYSNSLVETQAGLAQLSLFQRTECHRIVAEEKDLRMSSSLTLLHIAGSNIQLLSVTSIWA